MSTPDNPLAQYHSYSYHHILVVSDQTSILESLANSTRLSSFVRPPENVNTPSDPYGKYRPIYDGYSILINGMTDADFVISSVKWMHHLYANSGDSAVDVGTTAALNGFMIIEEPRGAAFMNALAHIGSFYKIDPSSLVWMLKTVFIGYPSPGVSFTAPNSTEYDPITNVRPLFLNIYGLKSSFNVEGGRYEVEFVGTTDGTTRLPAFTPAADSVHFNVNTSEQGPTLVTALEKLENYMNENYQDNVRVMGTKIKTVDPEQQGKTIRYIIRAEEPYGKLTGGEKVFNGVPIKVVGPNPDYTVTDFSIQNTDTGEPDAGGIISVSNANSVQSAIARIVSRSIQIKEEVTQGVDSGSGKRTRYMFRISSTIIHGKEEDVVVFKLGRFKEADNTGISKELQKVAGGKQLGGSTEKLKEILNSKGNIGSLPDELRDQILVLDYIYTGLNTDIINFDMNMNMLAAFMSINSAKSMASNQLQSVSGQPGGDVSGAGTVPSPQKTPVGGGVGTPTGEPDRNFRQPYFSPMTVNSSSSAHGIVPSITNDYQVFLSRWAGMMNISASITIHGNPGLLNSMNLPPSEVAGRTASTTSGANKTQLFPYWHTLPSLCKINVKFPIDTDNTDELTSFWYLGFYQIFSVKNSFESSLFTQELQMYALMDPSPDTTVESTEEGGSREKTNAANISNGTAPSTRSSNTITPTGTPTSGATPAGSGNKRVRANEIISESFTTIKDPSLPPELQAIQNNFAPDEIPGVLSTVSAAISSLLPAGAGLSAVTDLLSTGTDLRGTVAALASFPENIVASGGGGIIPGDLVTSLGSAAASALNLPSMVGNLPDLAINAAKGFVGDLSTNLTGALGGGISSTLSSVGGGLGEKIGNAVGGLTGGAAGSIQGLVLGGMVGNLAGSFGGDFLTDKIGDTIANGLNFSGVSDKIPSLLETPLGLDSLKNLTGVAQEATSALSGGSFISSAVDIGIGALTGGAGGAISGIAGNALSGALGGGGAGSGDIGGIFGGVQNAIGKGISNIASGGITSAVSSVGKGVLNIASEVKSGVLGGALTGGLGSVGGAISGGFDSLGGAVPDVSGLIGGNLSNLTGSVLNTSTGALGGVLSPALETATKLANSAKGVTSLVQNASSSLLGDIGGLSSKIPSLGSMMESVNLGDIMGGLSEPADPLGSAIGGLSGSLGETIGKTIGGFTGGAAGHVQGFVLGGTLGNLAGSFSGDFVSDKLNKVAGGGVGGVLASATSGLLSGAAGGTEIVGKFQATVDGALGGALGGADDLTGGAVGILQGVAGNVADQVTGALSSVNVPGLDVGGLVSNGVASLDDLNDLVAQPNLGELKSKTSSVLSKDLDAGFKPALVDRQKVVGDLVQKKNKTITEKEVEEAHFRPVPTSATQKELDAMTAENEAYVAKKSDDR